MKKLDLVLSPSLRPGKAPSTYDIHGVVYDVLLASALSVRSAINTVNANQPTVTLDGIPDEEAATLATQLTLKLAAAGWHIAMMTPSASGAVFPLLDGEGKPDETMN